MKEKTLHWYTDSGHAWLRVSKEEIKKSMIADRISDYSYQSDNYVYLEEDCDAGLYLDYLGENNVLYRTIEHYTENSNIRNLHRFKGNATQ